MNPIQCRHLILHPGSPKTGTSGIQNALFRARSALLEQGFLYPLAGVPTVGDVARGHHDIARRLDPRNPEPEGDLLAQLDALRGEIAACPDHTVILSSEEFFGVERLRCLGRLLQPQRLTVYVSLRPQHEVLNANYYTQVTHNRLSQRPDAYFDWATPNLRYLEKLNTLTEMCPQTQIHLRLFQKGSPARTAPLADFVETLGLHLPQDSADNAVEHPTLPAQATLFLRWLNEIGLDPASFFDVFQSLHRMRAHLPAQISTMSPARIDAVTQTFDAENREIRRRYLDGQDAPLFDPPRIPDPVQWDAEIGEDHARVERAFLIYLCNRAALAGGADADIGARDGRGNATGEPHARRVIGAAM